MDADEVLARLMVPGGRASVAETVAFERVNVELSDDVFPKMVAGALRALRTPVPREVSFHPGRVIESTVGLEGGPGNWNIHQMHAVLPTRPGRARVLFRISTDFVVLPELARSIGGQVWANLAEMVLHEQLEHVRPAGGGGRRTRWRRRATRSGCGRCQPTDSMRRIVGRGAAAAPRVKQAYYSCDFPADSPADFPAGFPADSPSLAHDRSRGTSALPSAICMGWYTSAGRHSHARSGLPSNSALMSGRPARVFWEPMYTAATASRLASPTAFAAKKMEALYATRSAAKIAKSALTSPAATPNPPLKVLQKVL